MKSKIRYFAGPAFLTACLLSCCHRPVSSSLTPDGYPSWMSGLEFQASDKPGSFLALRNLLFSFYDAETRWPLTAAELNSFAITKAIPFRPKDYPELTLSSEPETGRLRYSFKLLRWTVIDVLDAPSDKSQKPKAVKEACELPKGSASGSRLSKEHLPHISLHIILDQTELPQPSPARCCGQSRCKAEGTSTL